MNTDIQSIYAQIQSGTARLIDVRTLAEYQALAAPHSHHLDLRDIMHGASPGVSTDVPLYVYCRSGNRSGMAAQLLRSRGYQAYNVGGLTDWLAAIKAL